MAINKTLFAGILIGAGAAWGISRMLGTVRTQERVAEDWPSRAAQQNLGKTQAGGKTTGNPPGGTGRTSTETEAELRRTGTDTGVTYTRPTEPPTTSGSKTPFVAGIDYT